MAIFDVLSGQMLLPDLGLPVCLQPGVDEGLLNFDRFLSTMAGCFRLLGLVLLLVELSIILHIVILVVRLTVGRTPLLLLFSLFLGSTISGVRCMLLGLWCILFFLFLLVLLVDQLDVLLLLLILGNGLFFPLLAFEQDIADLLGEVKIYRVVLNETLNRVSAIVDL